MRVELLTRGSLHTVHLATFFAVRPVAQVIRLVGRLRSWACG